MVCDLVIRGGRVVSSARTVTADVAIQDGRILAVGNGGDIPEGRRTLEARGMFVLPGIIDPHAHLGYMAQSTCRCSPASRIATR